jgi:hypothetical protein
MQTEAGLMSCMFLTGSVCSVEEVAYDGTCETECVGAVDTKLVGAACERAEQQVCRTVLIYLHDFIFCMCFLALFEINFLPWPFIVIRR